MKCSMYDYCIRHNNTQLLRQWDFDKNTSVSPETLSYGSKVKVWWKCGSGHSWQAAVYSRTAGTGCPVCADRVLVPGENDLKTTDPELCEEWDFEKNGSLTPEMLFSGSHKKVWWRCEHGHSWQATVKSRAAGAGCPMCSNRVLAPGENDLKTTNPELCREWDFHKNGSLTPENVISGSHKKVWWRCKHGHSWQAAVVSRTRGMGCPVCTGKRAEPYENDLATRFPNIAAQWNYQRNGKLTPERCTPASNRKVWWRCDLGHEYQAEIRARTAGGSGCPYCAGRKVLPGFNDLAALEPQIAAQWHPTMNGNLTPDMVTVGSGRRVWWQCPDGHVWKAVIYSRTGAKKCGCPVCAGKINANRQKRYGAIIAENTNPAAQG